MEQYERALAIEEELSHNGFGPTYGAELAHVAARDERARAGRIVIKASERPWEVDRMARLKAYVHEHTDDTALSGWWVFLHEIWQHSGSHRHQGGLVLFVVEGQGGTMVDGKMYEWEEGDLVVLPIKPGAVEHQHFSRGDKPASWLAFIHVPTFDAVGSELTHMGDRAGWQNSESGKEI